MRELEGSGCGRQREDAGSCRIREGPKIAEKVAASQKLAPAGNPEAKPGETTGTLHL